ncbi:MAG: GspH/FimT family pseudopilin [Geminicoccaceae bacterium]
MKSGERGFTLLELLVVLVIIGLAASLIPGFTPGRGSSTALDHAARTMASGLRDVRETAIRQNQGVIFLVDVESRQFRPGAGAQLIQIDGDIALDMRTARQEQISETGGGIRFFPDGSSTGGRVVLAAGSQRRTVEVDWLTGDVSVKRHVP